MGFIIFVLWVVFIVSAILLAGLILLQEGKGGGLGEAFGGAGAETFGVKAGGVTKLTGVLAVCFIGSAILVGACREDTVFEPLVPEAPPVNIEGAATTEGGDDAGSEDK